MNERRYSEEEVAAIFERATEVQQTAAQRLTPSEGMTLTELQAIGREVGIAPELVAQAARSLDRSEPSRSRTFLGLPIGVGRTVDLERRLTEQEWERLVVDLRETFDAPGRVSYEGRLRRWTNGNLQMLLEPIETGHRVRLQTVKGSAREMMTVGFALLGIAAAAVIALLGAGRLGEAWPVTAFLSAIGLGMFGISALRLPGWARLRARQMEAVASRLALATEWPPMNELPSEEI